MDIQMLMTLNMSGNSTTMDVLNSTSPSTRCSLTTLLMPFWTLTAFGVANIFFQLPLLVFVLFLGCQRWLESSSSISSHSDVFTYNMVAMEMIQISANICFIINLLVFNVSLNYFSQDVFFIISSVKPEFQVLTCVELYLAVVFPIVYLRHKTSAGVTIRNISIGLVWLSCIVWAVLVFKPIDYKVALILYFLQMAFMLFVVCFCCFSVLWTLKQCGPGNRTGDREQVDQSKLRAFYTILVIMTVLLLSLGGVLVCDGLNNFHDQNESSDCSSVQCAEWMTLPSSFVLPVLFLQRAGKLPCCTRVSQSNK